jgi:hypothetical protein
VTVTVTPAKRTSNERVRVPPLRDRRAGQRFALVGSNVSTTSPYCHVAYGILTQARGLATYTIPRLDVQVSGVIQSKPGALLAANAVPASTIAQTLGRLPSGQVSNVTINLIEPGSRYGDRVDQRDFRAAKLLKFGATRTMVGVGSLQCAERQSNPHLQEHVRPRRQLAAAPISADGTNGANQRRVHVLVEQSAR